MPETLTVSVRREHIEAGRPWSLCGCPLALALRDATGEEWAVTYFDAHRPGPDGWLITLELPPEALKLARCFDIGKTVEPLSFEVVVP